MKKLSFYSIFIFILISFFVSKEIVFGMENSFLIFPLENERSITCEFGCYLGHKGTDYHAPMGTNVIAAADGKVIDMNNDFEDNQFKENSYGNFVKIDHQNGYITIYAHLKKNSIKVKKGDDVKKGDVIAETDNSGYSTGPHLHFEVKKDNIAVNPYATNLWVEDEDGKILTIQDLEKSEASQSQSSSLPSQSQGFSFSPSPPGLAGGSDTLSFWDKVAFYWNGFVANLKQLFGGTTGEVQVAQPLTNTEIQQQVNQEIASPPARNDNGGTTTNNPQQPTENSSPPAQSEVWNQRFISYELTEQDKEQGIYQLVLKFQNTGNTTWTPNNVSLNIVGGYQSTAAKFYHPSWTTKLRPTKLITTIEPGGNAFFTFLLQFPKEPGTYYPQFQPVYYDGTNFHWIGTDKAIFLAEIKQSSQDTFAFAGASLEEIINSNQETQNPETTPPPISYYYPPEPEPTNSPPSAEEIPPKEEEDLLPLAPKLISPEDGVKININDESDHLTFKWRGSFDLAFTLEISTDQSFSEEKTTIIKEGFVNNPADDTYEYTYSQKQFSKSTTYYWQVKGKDQNGNMVYSEIRSFRIPGWQIELVDEGGSFWSFAFDKEGNPAIAYTDNGQGWGSVWGLDVNLKYAHFNSQSNLWEITVIDQRKGIASASLAFDKDGNPGISYCATNPKSVNPTAELHYIHFNGKEWIKEKVDEMYECRKTSLAFNQSGLPAIAYGTENVLLYAYFNGEKWQIENIDSGFGSGTFGSLAFNKSDMPCISYTLNISEGSILVNNLRYACFDGTNWKKKWVDTLGDGGYFSSLVFDEKGNPSIVHITSLGLRYAHFDGINWNLETIEEVIDFSGDDVLYYTYAYTSLAFNPITNNPAISYLSASYSQWGYPPGESDLKYAYFDGLTWQKEVVDSEDDVGYFSSLSFDKEGNPVIAYSQWNADAQKYFLKFAIYK